MATLATKVATALANLAGAFFYVYLCRRKQDLHRRVKAAAQHSSSELGSAFALHFPCIAGL